MVSLLLVYDEEVLAVSERSFFGLTLREHLSHIGDWRMTNSLAIHDLRFNRTLNGNFISVRSFSVSSKLAILGFIGSTILAKFLINK